MIIGDQIGPQPEGVVVISSFPDPPHDRVILEVDRIVDQHLHRIAEKYGAKSIAVRVSMDDGGSPAGLAVGSAPVTPTPARP